MEEGLLNVTSFSNRPASPDEADKNPEITPGDRTYSIGDILAVLGNNDDNKGKLTGTYKEPKDITSYITKNDSSQASSPGDVDVVDDQNTPLIQPEDHITADPCVTEVMKKHNRNNADRDHYKSINSVLSELTGLSVEDLHSNRNSKDFDELVMSDEDSPKKTRETDEITDIQKENGNEDVKDLGVVEEREFGRDKDKTEQMNYSKGIYPGQVDDNLLKTADEEKFKIEKSINETGSNDVNNVEPDYSDNDIDYGIWDSGEGKDFNDLLNQGVNHYKQTADMDMILNDAQSDDHELHSEGNSDVFNTDKKDTADNLGIDSDPLKESTDTDNFITSGNVKKDEEHGENKQSDMDNPSPTGDVNHVKDDQVRNKHTADIPSNTSNGWIPKDKSVTSRGSNDSRELKEVTSLDNSETLQSYVKAKNEISSGDTSSDHGSQSDKIKCKMSNLTGNTDKNEQILHSYNEQECR